jgi:hypothetical protein
MIVVLAARVQNQYRKSHYLMLASCWCKVSVSVCYVVICSWTDVSIPPELQTANISTRFVLDGKPASKTCHALLLKLPMQMLSNACPTCHCETRIFNRTDQASGPVFLGRLSGVQLRRTRDIPDKRLRGRSTSASCLPSPHSTKLYWLYRPCVVRRCWTILAQCFTC